LRAALRPEIETDFSNTRFARGTRLRRGIDPASRVVIPR
jgi:hypothetical protein